MIVHSLSFDPSGAADLVRRLLNRLEAANYPDREAAVEALSLELCQAARESTSNPRAPGPDPDRVLVDRLCAIDEGLSDWEVDFVESVAKAVEKYGSLTPARRAKAEQVLERKGL